MTSIDTLIAQNWKQPWAKKLYKETIHDIKPKKVQMVIDKKPTKKDIWKAHKGKKCIYSTYTDRLRLWYPHEVAILDKDRFIKARHLYVHMLKDLEFV